MTNRRELLKLTIALPFSVAVCPRAADRVRAQDVSPQYPWPARTITIVVPFPPGGPTDVMARLIAQRLSSTLGSVILENKAGAGGTIGTKAVAAAEPDGYNLLFGGTSTLAINPAVYKDLRYDPVTSFAPVAMASTSPFVLVVHPAVPVHTVDGTGRSRSVSARDRRAS